ncbi:hypothetical protein LZ30DRAFT_724616 [Colletotrichum cereale]|nr:hypothetical protein LZ30DRAFT_724616 [Colletotrichum cereale]
MAAPGHVLGDVVPRHPAAPGPSQAQTILTLYRQDVHQMELPHLKDLSGSFLCPSSRRP